MSAFTGTGTIVRLVLRRDRIKLPAWIIALAGFMALNVPAVMDVYGGSVAEKILYAKTAASGVVGRVFGGPLNGIDTGAIVLNETFLFTAILVAFMSTLAIVRHTRQNEETGREEMIGSGIVGRHASLAAAIIVTIIANVLLAALIAGILATYNLPVGGSIATGAALAGVGVSFAAVAAIAAQLPESARSANSLAAIAIGIAFLLRGVGDGIGTLTQNGTSVESAWPSWFSPIGWGQQLHPYTEQNWIALVLFGSFSLFAFGIAFFLNAYRDVGQGIIPDKPGPAHGAKSLLSPLGLAWRLQRGLIIGWSVGMIIMGSVVGFIATEFGDLIKENEQVAEIMGALGAGSNLNDIIIGSMMSLMALATAGYAIQSLLRMRAEESGGQLESVLATNISKHRWMLSHIFCVFAGILTLTLLLGISSAISYLAASGDSMAAAIKAVPAAIVHIPAILVVAGFVIAVFGSMPRLAIGLSWLFFALCMSIGQFGAILDLPQWLLNLSPFTHTPFVPATDVNIVPLIAMSAIGLLLLGIGLLAFRRRDLTTA